MKRRDFLRYTGPAVTLPLVFNGLPIRAVSNSRLLQAIASSPTNRIMVFVQLQGGNDGLNTILPLDRYSDLSNSGSNGGRQEILIPANDGLKFELNSVDQYTNTRMHPSMGAFHSMYSDEKLCVIQGTGYSNQNFSHFRSSDIWMSASDPGVVDPSGWIGRKLAHEHPSYSTALPTNPLAITIGSISSNVFTGPAYNMGITVQNPTSGTLSSSNVDTAPNSIYGHELEFVRNTIAQTNSFYGAIQSAYNMGANITTYPNNYFANQLKTVARLINGGLDTRFYLVSLGGFDTHDNQVVAGDTKSGNHASLLKMLTEGIQAFQNDIAQLTDSYGVIEDRVIGMTFSEFGRTIKANTTRGTDHGTSAPMFIFGQDVNPIILGENPVVYDTAQNKMKSDLDVQFDFRSVYASILHQWFELPVSDITVYLGKTFQDGSDPGQNIYDGDFHCNLPIFKPTGNYLTSVTEGNISHAGHQNYPNPFSNGTDIPFESDGSLVEIKVYNSVGQEVRTLANERFPSGSHTVRFDTTGLPKGIYVYRIKTKGSEISRQMMLN